MSTKSLVFEIVGLDRASATFEKIGAAAEASSEKMSKFQRAGQLAGKIAAVGIAGVAFAAVESTKAAGEAQAAQAQLAQQMKNGAGATDEQVKSTNEWIEAQASAKGVSVDELTPAMAKLVTATGKVGKAQRDLGLAMNISAGTGKDLSSVSSALVKAQNGSLGGLSRLGVATKDASGHTMTLAQVTDELNKKYKGDAAKAADTLTGRQKVLGVQFHELEVKIGTQLIPVMSKFVGVLIKVVDFIAAHTSTIGFLIGTVIALAAAIKILTLAQAAFNFVMDANPVMLVVIALVALTAGVIYAYKHCETFRNIVNEVFGFLKKFVPEAISKVVSFVKDHWQLLIAIIGGPLGIVVGLVIKHFTAIKNFITQAIAVVVASAKDVGKFATAVGQHVADAAEFFQKLPGKIAGFLAGLPGQMLTLGGNIVQGLVHGIENAAGAVMNAVQALVDKIPKKIRQIMGIASPSKVTYEIGKFIGDGLANGIAARADAAAAATKKVTDKIKQQLQTLQSDLASTVSGVFGNLTGSMFSASATDAVYQHNDAVTDENGKVITPASDTLVTPAQTAGQNFVSNLQSTAGGVAGLKAAFKSLKASGWSPALLAQLFAQGGPDLIIELGSNSTEAGAALSALHTINKGYNSLGNMVGQNQYGDQIDADEDKLHHGKGKGKKGGGASGRTSEDGDLGTVTLDLRLDGRPMQKALLKLKRENGNLALGLA